MTAEAFDLETPAPDLRDRVDAATAEYILNQFGGVGAPPAGALAALLDPVVAKAIAACRAAYDQAADAAEARQVLLAARAAGQVSLSRQSDGFSAFSDHGF